MFIIEATSKLGNLVYRIDRKRYPNRFWSSDISKAYQYNKEEIAIQDCNHLKFGNPKVRQLDNNDLMMIVVLAEVDDVLKSVRQR